MTKEIRTEITISATKEKVWEILTNFKDYPTWNPFVKSLKGDVAVGNRIEIYLKGGMTFKPKIICYDANKKLSWLGHLFFQGLFDGEHSFELTENRNGTTTFTHAENFKGFLVPFFKKKLETETKNGFIEMNRKLKELAEQE